MYLLVLPTRVRTRADDRDHERRACGVRLCLRREAKAVVIGGIADQQHRPVPKSPRLVTIADVGGEGERTKQQAGMAGPAELDQGRNVPTRRPLTQAINAGPRAGTRPSRNGSDVLAKPLAPNAASSKRSRALVSERRSCRISIRVSCLLSWQVLGS